MSNSAYLDYWRRKQLLAKTPHFTLSRWWPTDKLCDIEQIYFESIRSAKSLLDVGAGDLRIQKKLRTAGFKGEYHTQDIGSEFAHTYQSLDDIRRQYNAIICLDVIEHMVFDEGLALIRKLIDLLEPGGVLILQTPNARCIRSPFGSDMTHLHIYNLSDLWALARALGLDATGYRVWFAPARLSATRWIQTTAGRLICTTILGADYADNIALVARKLIAEWSVSEGR